MSQCSGNGRHVGSIQTPGYRLGYHTVLIRVSLFRMPDIIGDPAFVCLGLASAEDGLIVISLRLRFLSCCGVTGNSLFPGSAVKYLENIS